VKYCAAAAAANLVEDGFTTCAAWALVAKLLANVRAAFEQPAALPGADVLSFKHVVHRPWCGMKRPLLALAALTL